MAEKYFALSAILLASACAAPSTVQFFRDTGGLERASFDMECPKEQLNVVALKEMDFAHGADGSQAGVTGCGQKAVYVRHKGGWVLNSDTSTKSADDK